MSEVTKIEREDLRAHSVPRCALLRVRRFCADPLALLPRSLPDARWRTFARAGRSPASQRYKGAVLDDTVEPSEKLTRLANKEPFPANFAVGNRAGNCEISILISTFIT